jgi:hypothetical protein
MKSHYYRYLALIAIDTLLSMAWHLGTTETQELYIYYASMALRATISINAALLAGAKGWKPGRFALILVLWYSLVSVADVGDTLGDGNVLSANVELSLFVSGAAAITIARAFLPDKKL